MKKVLIVEDDKKIRVLLKRLLEKKFHMEVCEAEDGLQGLEVCRAEKPRMVFLDILMPNMNGLEFLQELRQTDKETRVVVMTGMVEKETVQKMLLLGITDYVIKSEFIFQLESRIGDILYANLSAFK